MHTHLNARGRTQTHTTATFFRPTLTCGYNAIKGRLRGQNIIPMDTLPRSHTPILMCRKRLITSTRSHRRELEFKNTITKGPLTQIWQLLVSLLVNDYRITKCNRHNKQIQTDRHPNRQMDRLPPPKIINICKKNHSHIQHPFLCTKLNQSN